MGNEYFGLKKSTDPLQLVVAVGSPMDMACSGGNPQPSPRVGRMKASTELYKAATSSSASREVMMTKWGRDSGALFSFSRASFKTSSRTYVWLVTSPCVSGGPGNQMWVRTINVTMSVAVYDEKYAWYSTSQPFRSSHLKWERNLNVFAVARLGLLSYTFHFGLNGPTGTFPATSGSKK
eukprot:gene21068-biopygen21349